ncbi:MAG: enoyl-CoA hydratase/isomerase family protein, partial [Candidatus Bipolaricaulota bacterium]
MKGSYETVEVKLEDGVGELTLNRPEQLNSLNQQLRQDLKQAFSELETADIRVLTIRGSGKAFSAGADIEE